MAQGEQKVTARSAKGAPFTKLSAKDQDAMLTDVEKKVVNGFMPNASTLFNLVRTHTIQGTFCDPYYGGNANFVGWDLIGYPGIRLWVIEDEQRMNVRTKPIRQSAYDRAVRSISWRATPSIHTYLVQKRQGVRTCEL